MNVSVSMPRRRPRAAFAAGLIRSFALGTILGGRSAALQAAIEHLSQRLPDTVVQA
jgi:hypothetical protein